jgi:transposase
MELGLIKVIPFLATISTNFAIDSVKKSTSSILNLSNYIISSDKPQYSQVKSELESLDIYNSVYIIFELVLEQQKYDNLPNSTKRSIISVNDILSKIEDELNTIKNAMIIHEKKYFNKWRQFDCSINIDIIKKHEKILFKRYKLLRDLIMVNTANKNNLIITNNTNNYDDII